jgi:L,D-transpeptidase catalytic domain
VRILSKILVVCTILLAGCAPDRDAAANRFISQGTLALQGTENRDEISYWNGTSSEGEPRIVIDLDQQRAYFYKGDQLVGVSVVSTGREGYDTPPGEFRIIEKDREHVSSLYGGYVDQSGLVVTENVESDKDPRPRRTIFRGAAMPYLLRIHGGIGMHAGYLPGLSGVTWLYSLARENGSSIFSECCCRHSRGDSSPSGAKLRAESN